MNGNRIIWIDYSKAILITLVVLAHSPQLSPVVDSLIVGFHMPAFFIISGYLHKVPTSIVSGVRKNVRRLLVPALLFTVLCYAYWLLKYLLRTPFSYEECIVKPLLGLFFYDRAVATPICGVIWFLVVLFLCFWLLDCTMRFLKRPGVIVLSLVFVAISIWFSASGYKDFQYWYYLQRIVISFPFVAFGFLCHEYNLLKLNILPLHPIKRITVIACGLTIVYIFLALYNGHVGIHSCTFGKSVVVYWLESIIGSLALFHWTGLINKAPAWIIKISSGTIVILCLHITLIGFLVHVWVNPYFITAVIMVVTYPMITVFSDYLPWFVGRSYLKKG